MSELINQVSCLHPEDRDPYLDAEACIRIGALSAQSTVYLLPNAYNNDIIVNPETWEDVEVNRVLKIAHSFTRAENAVALLGLVPDNRRSEKASELVIDGLNSISRAMEQVIRSDYLTVLFGNPRLCRDAGYAWNDKYHMAYTQDYAEPLAEIIPELDMKNIKDIRTGMEIIDACVDTQVRMAGYGLFERTFKFVDNFGLSTVEELGSIDTRMRLLDLGELSNDEALLHKFIDDKEWTKITGRHEYTQLPPFLQAYLNRQCEKLITHETVSQSWRRSPLDRPIGVDGAVGLAYDNRIPHKLARVLWEKSPEGSPIARQE